MLTPDKKDFYSNLKSNSAKLIFLQVRLKRDDVRIFREVNRTASKGIRTMESRAFFAIYGLKGKGQ